jgi:hypothetical protein
LVAGQLSFCRRAAAVSDVGAEILQHVQPKVGVAKYVVLFIDLLGSAARWCLNSKQIIWTKRIRT